MTKIKLNKKTLSTGAENRLTLTLRKLKLQMIGVESFNQVEVSEKIVKGKLILEISKKKQKAEIKEA